MAKYVVEYSVNMHYQILVDANSEEEAAKELERIYEEEYDKLPDYELDIDHTVNQVFKVEGEQVDEWLTINELTGNENY